MLKRPTSPEDLEQLRLERDEADRRYNDALTALDRSLPRFAPVPPPPAAAEGLPDPIGDEGAILAGATLPPPRGVRTRLAHFVWRLIHPFLDRQQAFNRLVTDRLNREWDARRETAASLRAMHAALEERAAALATFHSHLIQYLQQVTPYADTKDRYVAGSLMAVYDAAINAMTGELLMRWESMQAREARFEARVAAVGSDQADIRGSLALLQQSTQTLKREIERLLASGRPADQAASAAPAPPSAVIDSYKYVGFEDRFRGSREEIRRRLTSYVPLFEGASDVLDVGCGRGELLDLLREAGIKARGIDTNHEMVEVCRTRGLDAIEADWLGYLQALPDASLGGLIAVQVVEHLEPSYLMRALDEAYHKLRPGSLVVLETINPSCWYAFFSSYIRDLTHVRPIHPETLQYLLTASGFQSVRIDYREPYPDQEKLQPLPMPVDATTPEGTIAEIVNGNIARLNGLLFTHLDYAAVGTRR